MEALLVNPIEAAPAPAGASLDPVLATDIVLLAAARHEATVISIAPTGAGGHHVELRRHKRVVKSGALVDQDGARVIDRLACIAGLGLGESATGRGVIKLGELEKEMFVTIDAGPRGLGAEVWLFDRAEKTQIPSLLPAGFAVGSYRIERILGDGGTGIVYQAKHAVLDRQVAIKVMRRQLYELAPHAMAWFLREARAAAAVGHPGIVDVYDVASLADGRPYLVMEMLQGDSLDKVLKQAEVIDCCHAAAIGARIAEALAAAHDQGIIHLDLKPSNVFVEGERGAPEITIVDFGAARIIRHDSGPSDTLLGTPYYMAPEQIKGLACDGRTDLYSLGVLLYEVIAGEVPFDGDGLDAVLAGHLHKGAPRLDERRADVPEALVAVVERLLAKRPEDRFADAREVAAALATVAAPRSRRGWRRWGRK